MAISPNGPMKSYQYSDDEDNLFNVTLSEGVATAAGFAAGDPDSSNWGTRGGRNKMRHVSGVTADGLHRAILPCPTIGILTTIYASGEFEIGGTSYNILGRTGERVTRNRF